MLRSLLFSFTAAAATLLAQTPGPAASIQIVADEDQVMVGRTLQVRAIVRDAQGNTRPDNVVWTTNNTNLASISQGGEVRALGLGIVRVVAQFQNIRVEAPIQTMPREVQVTPRPTNINVGENVQFTARALDADGNPIPNAAFSWAVTNRNGGGTSLLRTTTAGMVTGLAEGGAIVRATYTYNENIVGMQRQWMVNIPLDVTVPRKYELRRVFNNLQQMRTSFELRARPSMLWSTENGELFFNASLDGLTTALLNWNYGEWRSVTTAALPRFVSGTFTQDLRNHTVLPGGQIL
ncbi:MAG: Ig-like domain-containing protein, partial [Bryobacteraceae bacterium]|nr:Ig-like domain-containing protein [Bryobacteraceae bacterium]